MWKSRKRREFSHSVIPWPLLFPKYMKAYHKEIERKHALTINLLLTAVLVISKFLLETTKLLETVAGVNGWR